MDRQAFYNGVRETLFGGHLSTTQVAGMDALLDAFTARNVTDVRFQAYLLATDFHETWRTMQPIKEVGGSSYFFNRYDPDGSHPSIARALGNTETGDGVRFCGRGIAQTTGRRNYALASTRLGYDFVKDPDAMMQLKWAVPWIIEAMTDGLFTGKKLANYFNDDVTDALNARRIVNGIDRATLIKGYYDHFMQALNDAQA